MVTSGVCSLATLEVDCISLYQSRKSTRRRFPIQCGLRFPALSFLPPSIASSHECLSRDPARQESRRRTSPSLPRSASATEPPLHHLAGAAEVAAKQGGDLLLVVCPETQKVTRLAIPERRSETGAGFVLVYDYKPHSYIESPVRPARPCAWH